MPVEIKRDDYAIQAYIKNIFLELPTYKFHHSPLNGDGDEIFVGRKKIKDKFLNILKNGEKNGAYLITGYRGMGKTSFVKSVLSEYTEAEKNSNGQVLKVDISFAQVDLKETDILRQITKGLIDQVSSSWFVRFANTLSLPKVFRFLSFIISISFGFLLFHSHSGKKIKSLFHLESNGSKNMTGYDLFWLLIGMIVLIGFVTIVLTYLFDLLRLIILRLLKYKYRAICNEYKNQLNKNSLDKRYKSNHKNKVEKDNNSSERKFWGWYEKAILEVNLYKKLIHVYERANASIVKESGLQSSTTNIPFGFINKDVRTFPIANAKEIEYELIRILREYNDFINYNKKFVIVFDELDKVEPAIGKSYYFDDNKSLEQFELSQSQLIDLRERKKVIINILASLKHFITEANARFIFIAGREMFDASLADIADRQSSISSIFHQIIYVDSFLKDKPETNTKSSGLTDLVEMYLEKVLIPDDVFTKTYELKKIEYEEAKKANPNLKHENEDLFNDEDINKTDQESFFVKYNRYLRMLGKKPEERLKIIFTLQHFIIYLTYRSNGSPKKMVKLLEDYIIKDKDKESKMIDDPLYVVVKNNSLNTAREESLYLRFSVKSQYKFGFITYLYRPFLLSYSQFLKKYSDNVLVATPYLMDHLIKFHPFAFSVQNLELLPEVLSANKNPILRFFIEELINFLSQNHLRETEIGLFEYKFFNKSANEITYLSKIFEEESAAFNFTLDETYFIKIFLRNKIKDIRNSYRDFKDLSGTKYIFSISFLNGLLGDCHYFDQEFDDAIVSYQDALQVLRAMPIEELKQEEFVLMIRLKLKLGLIFEKMKSFESALSVYNDSIKLTESYFEINLESTKKRTNGQISIFEDEQSKKTISKFNSLNELLQIVNQAYTASLYMQEKVGIEGLTIYKLKAYINAFEALVEKVSKHTMENTIVRANFYSNIGALLYYKNFSIGSKVQNNDDEKTNSLLSDLIKEKFVEYRLGPQVEIYDEPNFQQYPEAKYNKDFRFPFYAFLSYRKALKILIPFGEDNEQEPLISILNRSTKIIRDYHNSHNKVYLKNIAHTLSNIGDTLFSVLDTSKSKDKKLDSVVVLNRISKKWDDGNKISNAVSEISPNDNDLIKKERLVKVLIDIVDYESWKEELIQLEAGLTVEENFKVKLESLIKEVKKIKNLNNGETNLKRIENLKKLCANGWYLWDKDFNNEQLVEIIAFLRFEEIYEKKNLKLIEKEKLLTERKLLPSANEDEKLSEDENNLVKEKEELNYDWNQNKEKIAKIAEYITPLKNGYRIMAFLDKYVAEYFEYEDFKKEDGEKITNLGFIIFLYYLSGRFYSKAGKSVSMSFQLRKILQTIKGVVNIRPEKSGIRRNAENGELSKQEKLIKFLEEAILSLILEITSWNSNSTDRPQIYKFKNNLELKDIFHPQAFTKYIYTGISNGPEIKEAVMHFAAIRIKSIDFSEIKKISQDLTVTEPEDSIKKTDSPEAFKISSDMELPELSLIHPYVGIASQFKRVQELQFQITINRGFLKKKVFAGFEKLTKGENLLEKWEGDYFKIYKKVNPQNQEEHYEKVNKNEKDSPFVFIKGIVNCDENNKTDTKEGNSIEIHLKNYEQITINSVFCLIQIISILRIYDINFYMSYFYLAVFHRKLGIWLKHYKLCQELRREFEYKKFSFLYKEFSDEERKKILKLLPEKRNKEILKAKYKDNHVKEINNISQGKPLKRQKNQSKIASEEYTKKFDKAYSDMQQNIKLVDTYLEKMLGVDAMVQVDATSQFQNALQYFHKAKQMHSNGPVYKAQIINYIYLEDDFNDDLYHFGAALERQQINSYHIRQYIKELEAELKDSPIYDYRSYANTDPLSRTI